ncbi:hypothetical protein OESDEN_04841 [Oesophagostomum dentatum]|uniref:Tudor domain-containing protein n=1 Tax=Oesophagostomum dentatum TaxID=61180 RepID=A0A0B1TCF8_OESDE|nr:hypothetical protein OESDEN_04841 [Oesophagostomum dentatum]
MSSKFTFIRLGALAVIRLQYGTKSKTWTRVLVESRPDAAHAQVYLLDYGTRQLVNARSLCEMPIEMKRVPPQAFPIIPEIRGSPDLGPGEWEKLNSVRITARISENFHNFETFNVFSVVSDSHP